MVAQQLQFSVTDIRINISTAISWQEVEKLLPVTAINLLHNKVLLLALVYIAVKGTLFTVCNGAI